MRMVANTEFWGWWGKSCKHQTRLLAPSNRPVMDSHQNELISLHVGQAGRQQRITSSYRGQWGNAKRESEGNPTGWALKVNSITLQWSSLPTESHGKGKLTGLPHMAHRWTESGPCVLCTSEHWLLAVPVYRETAVLLPVSMTSFPHSLWPSAWSITVRSREWKYPFSHLVIHVPYSLPATG